MTALTTDFRMAEVVRPEDQKIDRKLMASSVFVFGALFSFGASTQSVFVLGAKPIAINSTALLPVFDFMLRFGTNLLTVTIIGVLVSLWMVLDRGRLRLFGLLVLIVTIAITIRGGLQLLFSIHPYIDGLEMVISDALVSWLVGAFIIGFALLIVTLHRRARRSERAEQFAAVQASDALTALQEEELRLRRDIADTLHGTLQQRLVVIESILTDTARTLTSQDPEMDTVKMGNRLLSVRDDVDRMREHELRMLSTALYPEALERGLVPAMRALLARVPSTIAVNFRAEGALTHDGLDQSHRLLLVRIAEEGISNALRHGEASRIDISVRGDGTFIRLEVQHIGKAPAESSEFSGLDRLKRRIQGFGGDIELAPTPNGGILSAWVSAA